jgi:hypothetical protein
MDQPADSRVEKRHGACKEPDTMSTRVFRLIVIKNYYVNAFQFITYSRHDPMFVWNLTMPVIACILLMIRVIFTCVPVS